MRSAPVMNRIAEICSIGLPERDQTFIKIMFRMMIICDDEQQPNSTFTRYANLHPLIRQLSIIGKPYLW